MKKKNKPRNQSTPRAAAPPSTPSAISGRHFNLVFFTVLAVLGLLIYFRTFTAALQLDDEAHLRMISNDLAAGNAGHFFYRYGRRLLSMATFAVNYYTTGFRLPWLHGVNLLIHIVNAFLVYVLSLKLLGTVSEEKGGSEERRRYLAISAALLFLVHPVQTQAVTYIIQRSTLIAALFCFLTLLFYLRFRGNRDGRDYAAAVFCAVCAQISKENAFILPFVILLVEGFFLGGLRKENRGKTLSRWLPFGLTLAIVPALSLFWSYSSAGDMSLAASETARVSRHDYLLTQLSVIRTYWRLLFFPVSQNLDYDYSLTRSLDASAALSFCLHAGLLAAAFAQRRKYPLACFGVFWFYLTLSVESGLVPISDVIFEHRLYLPLFGFALAAVSILWQFLESAAVFTAVALAVVLIFSAASWRRNEVWRTGLSLWQDVVSKSPRKARPWHNLAVYYERGGRPDQALEKSLKAVELDPGFSDAYFTIGNSFNALDRPDEAQKNYLKSIELNPRNFPVYVNLGILYGMENRLDEAVEVLTKAVDPENQNLPEAHYNLAMALRLKNDGAAYEYHKHILKSMRPDLYQKLVSSERAAAGSSAQT